MTESTIEVTIHSEVITVINFALQQNKIPIIQQVALHNVSKASLENVTLRIWTEPNIAIPYERVIQCLPEEDTMVLRDIELILKTEFLAQLTERLTGQLYISLEQDGEKLASQAMEIVALAYDEWHGSGFFPELLTAFVTPNHPEVMKINARAAILLGEWTGDPSLDAYQSQDPNRVRQQAAAVYAALQEENIMYAMPPASFETTGQRVRLCDAVMTQHLGTCLDLTLFYAACLEAMGLHPLLLLKKGHIFAGVWLEELSFPEAVQDDPALVRKRLASTGTGEIEVVECTAFTAGRALDFEAATQAAIGGLQGTEALGYIIDVFRARISKIRPLPIRIQTESGWNIQFDKREEKDLSQAPQQMPEPIKVVEGVVAPFSKKDQWERKLLDLGLRNTLINMRFTQHLIPILTPSLSDLEDSLADGKEFGIMAQPAEWQKRQGEENTFENIHDLGPYTDLIRGEFKNNRLRSACSEGELNKAMLHLFRTAKTSLEENGSNSLYLSLGLLRWYESKASQKPRYAPIVLLPVEILRKSANKGYVIRLRDEEPQMNITLLEMLKKDFGITVGGLDPLPLDDHGVDLRQILGTMRHAIMGQGRWDILDSAFLGIFSFSQFVMWNDLRNRSEDLMNNQIVKSLMEGHLTWSPKPMVIGERVSEDGVFLPIPADASQLYAIHAAGNGESFVLHGPPGTGKSQTITALIANVLAQGKTVLFVAEKMAALSVVEKRLAKLGLSTFVLELHSNKSRKRDVLEQLRLATEAISHGSAEGYLKMADQASRLRGDLDGYGEALHCTHGCGLSLFEMINAYEANVQAEEAMVFDLEFAQSLGAEDLQHQESMMGQIIAAAKGLGHPHQHPLHWITQSQYSQKIRTQLPAVLAECQKMQDQVAAAGNSLATLLDWVMPQEKAQWQQLVQMAGVLVTLGALPPAWAKHKNLAMLAEEIRLLAHHDQLVMDHGDVLSQGWTPAFLLEDGVFWANAWQTASMKWFLPKMMAQGKMVKQLLPLSKGVVDKGNLTEAFRTLVSYQEEKAIAQKLLKSLDENMGGLYQEGKTNWANVLDLLVTAQESAKNLAELAGTDEVRIAHAARPEVGIGAAELVGAWEKLEEQLAYLTELLGTETPAHLPHWLETQREMCQDIQANEEAIREWMVWKKISTEAVQMGLNPVIEAYEKGITHEAILPSYRKGIYQALVMATIETEDLLNGFSGGVFNEKIAQFKATDQELIELMKEAIFARLKAKVPDFSKEGVQSSELGILQRAIRSGGRGISIRRLFEQIPNLLPRLCPCMLMSPISAAQYLDPKRPPFDLVVFDEASQLPTYKAVGALARGKAAIVVGDPNQMPPTSFFSGNMLDEDNLDVEDLESILDDCLALGMPQTHLLWHYRSQHESLIAFSNSQFYENKLYTFPSVNDLESRVRLVHVEGNFDRGGTRVNRKEAERVVDEIIMRCHSPELSGFSLGVVTFNISQQNLIDDLLTEACRTDSQLEAWAYEKEEPLFIKNLENVQGDERDVILFSIGYGPDKEGKVFMNFGPLNREGGWRRLNVAVSRARCEMVVFSGLEPEQINLSKTGAKGVAALKGFLEYAKGGRLAREGGNITDWQVNASSISNHICQLLKEAGYETSKMVGKSQYRIDLGVVDPRDPNRYLLGILLDGPSYKNAQTTRDRELAQVAVLNGLGWTIHRIWTMDWWDSQKKEMVKLLEKLAYLKEQPLAKTQPTVVTMQAKAADAEPAPSADTGGQMSETVYLALDFSDEVQEQDLGRIAGLDNLPKGQANMYRAAILPLQVLTADQYILPESAGLVQKKIRAVLAEEAPISEQLLIKRVLQSCGIARIGARLEKYTVALLQNMGLKYSLYGETTFYWLDHQDPESYSQFRTSGEGDNKRNAKDIPPQEVANAIKQVLEEQIGLPKEDLWRETAKKMGYGRMGNLVIEAMSEGFAYALKNGDILQDDYGYVTLTRGNSV